MTVADNPACSVTAGRIRGELRVPARSVLTSFQEVDLPVNKARNASPNCDTFWMRYRKNRDDCFFTMGSLLIESYNLFEGGTATNLTARPVLIFLILMKQFYEEKVWRGCNRYAPLVIKVVNFIAFKSRRIVKMSDLPHRNA